MAAKGFAAPHHDTRDNPATISLYTKLAVRLLATYGRCQRAQGISKICSYSLAE
jgi:hypothetical protein